MSALAVSTPTELFELVPLTPAAATELLGRLIGTERVEGERDAAGELVKLCGHLPIALCVAAILLGRTRKRTVASAVQRLRDEDRRLVALSPATDLSVSRVFTASYRQLGDSPQRCYLGLGLQPRTGRADAKAFAEVLGLPFYEVAEGLAELSESCFIDEVGDDRYTVSDLISLHASSLDVRTTEEKAIETERLLVFYHQRTYDADQLLAPHRPWRQKFLPQLRSRDAFDDKEAATRWLEDERPTLAVLVKHAAKQGDLERVCSWCILLWRFFEASKYIADLFTTHALGIDAAVALHDVALESLMRSQQGYGHYWALELDRAAKEFATAVQLARTADDRQLEATALEGHGLVLLEQGRAEAVSVLRENRRLAEEIDDPLRIAFSQLHVAKAEDPKAGLGLLAKAAAYFTAVGDVVNRAKCETWRGKHLLALDEVDESTSVLECAVEVMGVLRRRYDEAEALVVLGEAHQRAGRSADADRCWRQALIYYDDLGFTARTHEVRRRLA
jgi:tetratricopeptide (TPR) repeat protein